jgi:hypothetical protein
MLRNSGDKALIIREPVTRDDHALRGDFIFADILAMVTTSHLDNHHDLAKLAVDAYVNSRSVPTNLQKLRRFSFQPTGVFGSVTAARQQ